jgi:nitroreductase
MEFETVLYSRRSVRHFSEEELSRDEVQSLLDAAAWAPSGGNKQPWAVTALSPATAAMARQRWELPGWNALRPQLASMFEQKAGAPLPFAELQARTDAMLNEECIARGRPWLLLLHAQHVGVPEPLLTRMLAQATPELRPLLHRIWSGPLSLDSEVTRASVYGFMVTFALVAQSRGFASCIQFSYVPFAEEMVSALQLSTQEPVVATVLLGRAAAGDPVVERAQARAARRPVAVDFR